MELIPTKMIVSSGQKKEFTHQHIPVTVAVYQNQNVTTVESAAHWLVEKDPNVLVDKFVDYLMDLSLKSISHQRQCPI